MLEDADSGRTLLQRWRGLLHGLAPRLPAGGWWLACLFNSIGFVKWVRWITPLRAQSRPLHCPYVDAFA